MDSRVTFGIDRSEYFMELREKFPYSELFWSVFSRIWTDYGEILILRDTHSVRMRENTDQNNSEYVHFFRCVCGCKPSKKEH